MRNLYVAILAGFLAGCASIPSEYNQGCRDGITESTRAKDDGLVHIMQADGVHAIGRVEEVTNYYCDMLDAKRQEEQRQRRLLREHGGRR